MFYNAIVPPTVRTLERRYRILRTLDILDTLPEPEFDTITALAARTFDCPIALISLLDRDRQWFKSRYGMKAEQTPINQAICRFVVDNAEPLVINDTLNDPDFRDNPIVTGDQHIRFYAGVPLFLDIDGTGERIAVGTLCVLDNRARQEPEGIIDTLRSLADVVEALLGARLEAAHATRMAEETASALKANERLHRQLHQAERMANLGSWRLCLKTQEVEWSDQIYTIHGLLPDSRVLVHEALQFYPEEHRELLTAAIDNTIRTGEPYDLELDFFNARNEKRRVRAMGELELVNGEPAFLIGVFQDITARFVLEQALRHAADTDDLTQLYSRRHFKRQVEKTIEDTIHEGTPLVALLIDMDHFKLVNDRFGHAAGDAVLRETAVRLTAPWLAGSFAARLGGDEFVLLLTDRALTDNLPATVSRLLSDLVQSVDDLESHHASIEISATIGVALFDGAQSGYRDLLAQADAALYRAKQTRRGTARIADLDCTIVGLLA